VTIFGVVLAAGEGRRMGGPKALLRLGGESFAARASRLLARPGVEGVIVVVGHEAERVVAEAALPAAAIVVRNERHRVGMLSSVLAGLDEAQTRGAEAILLQPVDHALTEAETVERVIAALQAGATIAVPSFQDRRGHPGGFARAAWAALRSADPAQGARQVLAEHPEWIVHVPGGAGSIQSIDTPGQFADVLADRSDRTAGRDRI
jgi:nicotine blue oxidoreductase